MNKIFPIAVVASAALLGYGTYSALVTAPTDAMQGDVYRIIYYHVPSGWTMFVFFGINFIASVLYLIRRTPKADAVAVSAAEVGVVFCTVVLVTGPIWARPVWGIWWTWDTRLTSTFVLYLIYISYLLLRRYAAPGSTSLLAAVVAIFGAADLPLVYLSIWFFRTQHPAPVLGGGGSIAWSMLRVWLINYAAFQLLGLFVFRARYRLELLRHQVEERSALTTPVEGLIPTFESPAAK
jgi:heme exporter protein C